MAGKIVSSEALAQATPYPDLIRSGAFSPAVKAGPFVYVSGILARDTNKDMQGQATEVFEYMSQVLAEAGMR